ncbi:MAG: aminotransferase class III-fold pyridoxal phosphate-dependent enzyme [Puniceicoccaceae bacterium]|nr:MAG: aminotransferase class III-fold pyridoxal phosphate-dependent enzyme [Puniceicoccaceae bacterium]
MAEPPPTHPGPLSAAAIEELRRYVLVDPHPFVLDLPACSGMWLATIDGRRLFDWSGFYASRWIGYNHPGLAEPDYLRRLAQAANLKTANPDFLTPDCLAYYRELRRLAPHCMDNPRLEVYALNSGAEAVENMMKYFLNLHDRKLADGREPVPTRRRFLYFDQAFHGRTVFALNITDLTHDPVITKDFHGLIEGNIQIPFPAIDADQPDDENRRRSGLALERVEASLQEFAGEIVAVIVEPIQGAGGHRVAEPHFFRELSRLCHHYGAYLGFDEVQTAGGQTGAVFAADLMDLPHPPQAIATAKKFGCGVIYMLYPMNDYGVLDSTWGGNLSDMVRFCREAAIVREEKLIEAVPPKTERLTAALRRLQDRFPDRLGNIRGLGLYQGFTLRRPGDRNQLTATALQEEDLLLLGAGIDSIRLRPNLSVTPGDIDLLETKLAACLERL